MIGGNYDVEGAHTVCFYILLTSLTSNNTNLGRHTDKKVCQFTI